MHMTQYTTGRGSFQESPFYLERFLILLKCSMRSLPLRTIFLEKSEKWFFTAASCSICNIDDDFLIFFNKLLPKI